MRLKGQRQIILHRKSKCFKNSYTLKLISRDEDESLTKIVNIVPDQHALVAAHPNGIRCKLCFDTKSRSLVCNTCHHFSKAHGGDVNEGKRSVRMVFHHVCPALLDGTPFVCRSFADCPTANKVKHELEIKERKNEMKISLPNLGNYRILLLFFDFSLISSQLITRSTTITWIVFN